MCADRHRMNEVKKENGWRSLLTIVLDGGTDARQGVNVNSTAKTHTPITRHQTRAKASMLLHNQSLEYVFIPLAPNGSSAPLTLNSIVFRYEYFTPIHFSF